ncbi:hypothetical protein [Corynebacterium sp. H78]|uniref:hypothetical protein n=1 Tax=Corynebacterium sp. H78 TaxID=3133417 RepID=UPI0030B44BD4
MENAINESHVGFWATGEWQLEEPRPLVRGIIARIESDASVALFCPVDGVINVFSQDEVTLIDGLSRVWDNSGAPAFRK